MHFSDKTVAYHTFGCKLNYAETSAIARKMTERGLEKVSFEEAADVYVINTCSVTENANTECNKLIRKIKKNTPQSKVVLIGCYAQLQTETISKIPGVDLVLGAKEKFNIDQYVEQLFTKKSDETIISSCEIDEANFFTNAYSFGDRTRSFLKVQDGCDYTCSFCTIPLARGKSRSDKTENIVLAAKEIAKEGIKEIVLTGVNIGDFGKQVISNPFLVNGQQDKESFLDLIKTLDSVEGIERFRISSIEPNLLNNEIIEFVASSNRFMPHFHIPLQSGSNKILKLMRRRYLRELYAERIEKIKLVMPHCCIGADVIVGFPGETQEDFEETYNFLNALDISYLHVFTYSERENTHAISLPGMVPYAERKKRSKMLRILSDKKRRFFYTQNINQKRNVLFETENKEGLIEGFTDNYIKVQTTHNPDLINTLTEVNLEQINEENISFMIYQSVIL